MAAFYQQAVTSLKVYLQRGREALQKFQEGEVDEASDILVWRNAAFQNFRSAEYMLQGTHEGVSIQQMLSEIGPEIEQQNALLREMVAKTSQELRDQWANHKVAREKIGKFHSGNSDESGFKSSI